MNDLQKRRSDYKKTVNAFNKIMTVMGGRYSEINPFGSVWDIADTLGVYPATGVHLENFDVYCDYENQKTFTISTKSGSESAGFSFGCMRICIYRMPSGTYELNCYLS